MRNFELYGKDFNFFITIFRIPHWMKKPSKEPPKELPEATKEESIDENLDFIDDDVDLADKRREQEKSDLEAER